MNILYEVDMTYTFGEYKAYSRTMFRRQALPAFLGMEVLFLGVAVYTGSLFLAVIGLLWLGVAILVQNRQVKKIYASNKLAQNMKILFQFGESALVENTENGQFTVPYDKLHKILETKTHFYLMTAKNQGYMLNKAYFPEGLEDLLRGLKGKK